MDPEKLARLLKPLANQYCVAKKSQYQYLRKICEKLSGIDSNTPKLTSNIQEPASHDPTFSEKSDHKASHLILKHLKHSPLGIHYIKATKKAVWVVLLHILPI